MLAVSTTGKDTVFDHAADLKLSGNDQGEDKKKEGHSQSSQTGRPPIVGAVVRRDRLVAVCASLHPCTVTLDHASEHLHRTIKPKEIRDAHEQIAITFHLLRIVDARGEPHAAAGLCRYGLSLSISCWTLGDAAGFMSWEDSCDGWRENLTLIMVSPMRV